MLWKQKSRGSLSWLITWTISRFHEFNSLLSHVKANRSPDGTQTVGDTWPGSSEENEDRPTTDLWEDDVYKKNNYNCSNQRLGEAGEIDEALLLQHRALLKW